MKKVKNKKPQYREGVKARTAFEKAMRGVFRAIKQKSKKGKD